MEQVSEGGRGNSSTLERKLSPSPMPPTTTCTDAGVYYIIIIVNKTTNIQQLEYAIPPPLCTPRDKKTDAGSPKERLPSQNFDCVALPGMIIMTISARILHFCHENHDSAL